MTSHAATFRFTKTARRSFIGGCGLVKARSPKAR